MVEHNGQRTNGYSTDIPTTGFAPGTRDHVFALCRQTAKTIVETFGDICEVVIHDFNNIEHSVIHIEGNVTNRSVGAGPTDLLLKAVRSGRTEHDLHGYTGTTLDGKALRSSSMFLRDEAGYVFGAFCINVDVTQLHRLNAWTSQMVNSAPSAEVSETFTSDLVEVLEVMLAETAMEIGVPLAHMNRAQKIRLVQALQEKGGFQIKKAVTVVAERLGVSRFTVYNYLNTSAEELRRLETDEGRPPTTDDRPPEAI